jgi:hypothetical protein
MFRGKNYVPILRWKQAELEALGDLEPHDRKHIVPLFELLPKQFAARADRHRKSEKPSPDAVFFQIAKDIVQFWGYDPFFLDFQHIATVPCIRGLHPIAFATQELRALRARPILVCRLGDTRDFSTAVRSILAADKRGVCLRVLVPEVLDPAFPDRVFAHLDTIGVPQSSVDFLLDYQNLEENRPSFSNLFDRIPEIRTWRTLIASSGAFPEDLAEYSPGRYDLPRKDWIFYRDEVLGKRLARLPLFSDYTIQHGRYKEPRENSNPSASIRYTSGDHWVIMRGEGLRNKTGPKNEQYPAHAQLLCESDDFCGAVFSRGDSYLYDKFLRRGGDGTPQTWLRAGINHHMTLVARQLAGTDLRAVPDYRGDRPVESIQPFLRTQSKRP